MRKWRLLLPFVLVGCLLCACGKESAGTQLSTDMPQKVESTAAATENSMKEALKELKASKDREEATQANSENKVDVSQQSGSMNQTTISTGGGLQVVGTQLCDASGNPIQLRGISTHGIAWFPDYVNAQCVSDIHSWGANVLRLAMYTAEYNGYCTGGDQNWLKQMVDNGVKYATNNGMYVIIDWHVLNDNNPNTYKQQAIAFFNEMSAKYASYNNVIYEICNEPCNGTSWSDIKSYANEVIPVIRSHAPNAVIIVGTPNWSQYVNEAAADPVTGYNNIMYALHFYAATHKDELRNTMVAAISAGLPIFVSEYGICDASGNGAIDYDSANTWIRTLDQYGISYVCWNLSNKNESSAIIRSGCSKTSGFTRDDLSEEGKWLYDLLQSKR